MRWIPRPLGIADWVVPGRDPRRELGGTWQAAAGGGSLKNSIGLAVLAGFVIFSALPAATAADGGVEAGMPPSGEAAGIAIPSDADFPDFTIRLMRGGTELEISGGFKIGIARELRRVLDQSPDVRVVHLDSMGGWVNEGEIIRRIIAERGLATYVADICVSACTVAFAGGRERWLHPLARIGFHTFASSDMTGAEVDAYIAREKALLGGAGYDPAFLDRALAVPFDEVWYPTDDELTGARVVTGLASADQFALSGLGPDLSRDAVAQGFAGALPILDALRSVEPGRFDAMIEALHAAYLDGATESQLFAIARNGVMPMVQAYLPRSDDATLLSFAGLLVDQYRTLLGADGRLCFEYALGIDDPHEVMAHLPNALWEREQSLEFDILRTATALRPLPEPGLVRAYWNEAAAGLTGVVSAADLPVLAAGARGDPSLQTQYCEASIALFESVLTLDDAKASALLRDIFGSGHTVLAQLP